MRNNSLYSVSINEYFLNKLGNSGHSGSRWLLFCGILLTTKPSYLAVQCSSTNDFETEMTVESGHSILKSTKGLRPKAYNFFTTISRFFWPWLITYFLHESLIYNFFLHKLFLFVFQGSAMCLFFVKINSYIGIIFLFWSQSKTSTL